ncbi:MAG: MFS transporter [Candidatus Competibacteraceae bacterium]|nr:MFS transporter [Candidatus Competibacteraceae bacterium]MCB1810883.1 MFS transporter [Candidatus Competibacteraceae bacterium]
MYPIIRLIAALLLMTVGGSAMYGSIVILVPVADEFGVSRGLASLPYMLFMLGFGVGGVVNGHIADRIGILPLLLVTSLALPLGFFAAAHASTLWQLCLAIGVLAGGFGASTTFAPLVTDISHWFTARRGLAVGIVISGNYLAGAVWPPILQFFIDAHGWRETFIGVGFFTLGSMLLLSGVLYRRPPLSHDDASPGGGQMTAAFRPLQLAPNTLQVLLCAAGLGCCIAMAMPQVHIVAYATDLGYAAAQGAQMLSLMLASGIISRLLSGWISDRIGGLQTLLLGSSLQCLVLAAFLTADTLTALYVLAIAFGLSQGGIVPSYAIIVRTFFPARDAGWRIGTALFFTMIGMALGGWMAGALYDLTGSYQAAFINAIGFNIMNMVIAAWLLQRFRKVHTTRPVLQG